MSECSVCGRKLPDSGGDQLNEVIEMIDRLDDDWEYLSGEEKHGTVMQIRDIVDEVRRDN